MRVGDIHTNSPVSLTPSRDKPDGRKVAEEFESLFISYMLRSMRNTVERGDDDFIPESMGEKIYTDMLDGEYAKIIASNGSLGLADLIYKEIERNEDGESALDALRGLDRRPWMTDPRFVPMNQGGNISASISQRLSAFAGIIEEASNAYGVDADLIAAVIAQESSGNPSAVSPAGAKGLMQLIDSTAADMGVKQVFNPRDNILGGTRYLRNLLNLHGGNERLALASYNAGPAAVERYGGVPPYPETQNYVENVLRLRDTFAQQTIKDKK